MYYWGEEGQWAVSEEQDAQAGSVVRVRRSGGIAVIEIANPPMNAVSQTVRAGLMEALREAEGNATVAAVVLTGAGKAFHACTDIKELDGTAQEPLLVEVCAAIENFPKIVVAAVNGLALGSGFELALAAHSRIIAEGAAFALPELRLGVIPGGGGTQRLPRLIDAAAALEIAASGRFVGAFEAVRLGIAECTVPREDLISEAIRLAENGAGKSLRKTSKLPVRLAAPASFDEAKAKVLETARGQHAAVALTTAMAAALEGDFAAGCEVEQRFFNELHGSAQAKAMRHIFFAERQAGRLSVLEGVQPRPVKRIGIAGAGTMGAGIAGACLVAGYEVVLADLNERALEIAALRLAEILQKGAGRGRKRPSAEQLTLTTEYEAFTKCDLLIEAVFEDEALKNALMNGLGRIVPPHAVIATNTSCLDLDQLAAATGRPQDTVGLHFFAPAESMRAVEVVPADESAIDTVATAIHVTRRIGKLPIISGAGAGFIGARILSACRHEMEFVLEDGAAPWDVDAALEDYGFAMGPFAATDIAGLDIAWAVCKHLALSLGHAGRYSLATGKLCQAGRFGRKTGAGWYKYEGGRRFPDPAAVEIISEERQLKGLTPRHVPAPEIQWRARAAIINEAARVLDEGIASSPFDIDLALIHGGGYPVWRGGPMFDADRVGLANVLKDVERMCAANGSGFEPAPLLRELATRGSTFADWAKERKASAEARREEQQKEILPQEQAAE